jgi:hypothetical protein
MNLPKFTLASRLCLLFTASCFGFVHTSGPVISILSDSHPGFIGHLSAVSSDMKSFLANGVVCSGQEKLYF